MTTTDPKAWTAGTRERPTDARDQAPRKQPTQYQQQAGVHVPAAGAHAASHLVNEEATPGAGALPSHSHISGKEVDGGAG